MPHRCTKAFFWYTYKPTSIKRFRTTGFLKSNNQLVNRRHKHNSHPTGERIVYRLDIVFYIRGIPKGSTQKPHSPTRFMSKLPSQLCSDPVFGLRYILHWTNRLFSRNTAQGKQTLGQAARLVPHIALPGLKSTGRTRIISDLLTPKRHAKQSKPSIWESVYSTNWNKYSYTQDAFYFRSY